MKVSMKIKNRQGQQLAVQIQGVKNAPVNIYFLTHLEQIMGCGKRK